MAPTDPQHQGSVRILLLYGGEPFLWRDGQRRLRDVVVESRRTGFDYQVPARARGAS